MLKILELLKQAQFIIDVIVPVLESVVKKDLNKDGKIG